MRRRKVVCFVNHTAQTGGAELALLRLVGAMDRGAWHPVVVFGEEGPAAELFRRQSVETYVLPLKASLGKLRRNALEGRALLSVGKAFSAMVYTWKLANFFKERAVEIVHTNSMKAHVLGGLAARFCGIPLLWYLRDSFDGAHLPGPALRLMRTMARVLPRRIVCVSRSVAFAALGASWPERAAVVYDGLEESAFDAPASLDMCKTGAPWTVGIAGRLSPWKGQHLFLDAAALLLERGHKIHFEILGDALFGEEAYAARLQEFVRRSPLEKHVSFAGYVRDVPARIRSWDVLVHASTAPDPCPNVVLEAMAAGVPVVASAGGGVPELLEEGCCGSLFPMGDAGALCLEIESLLANGTLRAQKALMARTRALSLYRSEKVACEVGRIWEGVFDPGVFVHRKNKWLETPLHPPCGTREASRQPATGRERVSCEWESGADARI